MLLFQTSYTYYLPEVMCHSFKVLGPPLDRGGKEGFCNGHYGCVCDRTNILPYLRPTFIYVFDKDGTCF